MPHLPEPPPAFGRRRCCRLLLLLASLLLFRLFLPLLLLTCLLHRWLCLPRLLKLLPFLLLRLLLKLLLLLLHRYRWASRQAGLQLGQQYRCWVVPSKRRCPLALRRLCGREGGGRCNTSDTRLCPWTRSSKEVPGAEGVA